MSLQSAPVSKDSWGAPAGFGGPLPGEGSWGGSVQHVAAKSRVDYSQNNANLEDLMKKSKLSETNKPDW